MWYGVQRAIAALALPVVAPLIGILSLVIRLDSPGPAIYRGARVGLHGRPIVVHKLRTMAWAGRSSVPPQPITSASDPRITRVGRVLRRTRLDELPQLWDVARGSMALVGPRPEALDFVDLNDPKWRTVLSVRPGITGLTQLRFRAESALLEGPDPVGVYRETVLPEKLMSDIEYVRGRTARGDLRLLARTLALPLRRR